MLAERLRSRSVQGGLLSVLLVVVLAGWAVSSPPGASPDDGFHLTSIWCADGFDGEFCFENPGSADPAVVLVPLRVLELSCYQYDGSRSASCLEEDDRLVSDRLAPKESNVTGARPNLYYRAMHVFADEDVLAAGNRIRAANILLVTLMLLATALVATDRVRAAFVLSTLVVGVPLGLFLVTSVNSAAWGLAGLVTLWANGATAMTHPDRTKRIVAALLAVVGVVLAMGSRTEALVHVAVTVGVLGILWWYSVGRPTPLLRLTGGRRPLARGVLLVGLGAAAGMALLLAPDSASLDTVVRDIGDGYDRMAARGIGDPILSVLFEIPVLWTGAFGLNWGLGALDTPIPSIATVPLMAAFVILLVRGLTGAARPRALAATLVLVALLLFPTFALLRSALIVYEQLQPRQFMAMLFVVLGVALLRVSGEEPLRLGSGTRRMLTVALGLGHTVAHLVNIRRYVSGLLPGHLGEFRHVSFASEIEWWWAGLPSPNIVWAVTSVAFVAAVWLALRVALPAGTAPELTERATRDA